MGEDRLHIAVGVILDRAGGRVLLARRPEHADQGGLWEFPGGKRRAGEAVEQALRRELMEELGLEVGRASPFMRIDHDYPGNPVRLDVWRVESWHGTPRGLEGQQVEWVSLVDLRSRDFPEANRRIVAAVELPALYLITPDLPVYNDTFFRLVDSVLAAGVTLLQFRSTRLAAADRGAVTRTLAAACRGYGCRLLVNGTPGEAVESGADGVHLNAARLLQLSERPLHTAMPVAASCHNRMELEHAARLGLDFVSLGPVARTATHPEAEMLGWDRFEELAGSCAMPVYALGGLGPADMPAALARGAVGISAISAVWAAADPAAAAAACLAPGFSAS